MLTIYNLQTEHITNPIGIDSLTPRFGWKLKSDKNNVLQTSWHIIAKCNDEIIWDSGVVNSSQSQNVLYKGKPLRSRQVVKWEVIVTAAEETALGEAFFEIGLLKEKDWKAVWIETENQINSIQPQPSPYLRKKFYVGPGLVSARAYQTAHGIYRFWINGEECTKRRFAPGNTSYNNRLQYQVDDITETLVAGNNIWAVQLGDGWWRGACGGFNVRNNYGNKVQFLGQIILEYEDGSVEIICTDNKFKTSTGGLLQCDMKLGSIYDARIEPYGWKLMGFDDSGWNVVNICADENCRLSVLIAERSVPIVEKECFEAKVFKDKAGNLVLDFGQNIAGYVRFKVRNCKPGQRILLEHGEALNDGIFDNSNVYIAESSIYDMFQQVVYYANGNNEEIFTAEFSVFGFRYVRLSGYDGDILPGDFTAISVYSNLSETFRFSCSNHLVNKLVENSMWSQKGNFLDVPTDCPTRERSAWTGDAQVYCKTSTEFMDVYSFFEKWMQDINCEQAQNGQVPFVAPSITFHNKDCRDDFLGKLKEKPGMEFMIEILKNSPIGKSENGEFSAGWSDSAAIIPYMMYLSYGDSQILKNQYDSAKKWVDFMIKQAEIPNPLYSKEPQYSTITDGVLDANYIWDTGFHWGEWSEPDFVHRTLPANFMEEKSRTGDPVVATAYFSYSAKLLSRMAAVLNYQEDAQKYNELSMKVARIYDKYFIDEDGTILFAEQGRQAPYVRVLAFDLCSAEKRNAVTNRLIQLLEEHNYHLNTGFLSTGMFLNTLAKEGHTEAAYRLLEQTTPPSWLYSVTCGATTILESWDGKQRFFGSFNHYSYGAVCDFLFSHVSGIQLDEEKPGYKHFYLRPLPGGNFKFAVAEFESPYGKILSAWSWADNKLHYKFNIPVNTTATVEFINGIKKELGSGYYEFNE